MQADLFTDNSSLELLPMDDAEVAYQANFLSANEADHYLQIFKESLAWRQDHIKMFGKSVKIPRLQAWYGDPEAQYQYSGLDLMPLPWTEQLQSLRLVLQKATGHTFNGVLVNLYRNQSDSMGWHADNEPELGLQPSIASISLGEPRHFHMRHVQTGKTRKILLAHGSLLVMSGDTQRFWQHQITKQRKEMAPRINLTFRRIIQLEK